MKIIRFFRTIRFVLWTIYYSIQVVLGTKRDKSIVFRLSPKWAKIFRKCYKIDLEVQGLENIKDGERYILMPNHESLLDIPILFGAYPKHLVFMYKQELEKIPIFGLAIKRSPLLPIARNNPRAAFTSLDNDLAVLNEVGSSLNVFPEGTRYNKTDLVGPFKRGVTAIAKRAQLPILPVAIIGTQALLPAGETFVKSGKVKVIFGKAVDSSIFSDKAVEVQAIEDIRQWIIGQLRENAK